MGKQCVRIWEIQYVPQQLGQTPYHALRHALLVNHVRAEKKVEFAKVSVAVGFFSWFGSVRLFVLIRVGLFTRVTRTRMTRLMTTTPSQLLLNPRSKPNQKAIFFFVPVQGRGDAPRAYPSTLFVERG
jgi:hypothetical protein